MYIFLLPIAILIIFAALHFLRKRPGEREEYAPMKIPGDSHQAFIVCTFSMLAKLSLADGAVTAEEKKVMQSYIRDELGLNRKYQRLALRVFEEAKNSPLDVRDYAQAFQKAYPDRIQLHERVMRTLLALSVSDGIFSDEEARQLRSVALLLGFSEPAFEGIMFEYVKPQNLLH